MEGMIDDDGSNDDIDKAHGVSVSMGHRSSDAIKVAQKLGISLYFV